MLNAAKEHNSVVVTGIKLGPASDATSLTELVLMRRAARDGGGGAGGDAATAGGVHLKGAGEFT